MTDAHVLSVDLGAESGRVWSVRLQGGRLTSHEVHRFRNRPVRVGDTLHWDVLSLWQDVRDGLEAALADGGGPAPHALGIDAWAVDFGLLDRRGQLLGNPVHYRDARTRGMIERVASRLDPAAIFAETGIQFLPINTLYQLAALAEANDPQLEMAERLLLIPDLLHHWLTGRTATEFTNATTTQLYDAVEGRWSPTLLDALGLSDTLFPEVVPPGTQLGTYRGVPVIAPATHDTASAVAGLPVTSGDVAYVSSGTWSLVGTEVTVPVRNEAALRANVTNEGGVAGTTRLLKNVMGLWILQQCRETWAREGAELTYGELVGLAEQAAPLRSLVPVDHPDFLEPGDHPAIIARLCREHGEPIPQDRGAITRCVLESLALAYRRVLDVLAELTGRRFDVVHVVGGGSRNALLNRFTADAAGVPVVAGPAEATVLGNAAVQMMALGVFPDLATARRTIAASVQLAYYEPSGDDRWEEATTRYARLEASA
ncbi:MAG: rhamnulokinase family protein [Trueperaceae bacterium]|nr:rhamnulokinase family protein [Trueperaceae bacterium]